MLIYEKREQFTQNLQKKRMYINTKYLEYNTKGAVTHNTLCQIGYCLESQKDYIVNIIKVQNKIK